MQPMDTTPQSTNQPKKYDYTNTGRVCSMCGLSESQTKFSPKQSKKCDKCVREGIKNNTHERNLGDLISLYPDTPRWVISDILPIIGGKRTPDSRYVASLIELYKSFNYDEKLVLREEHLSAGLVHAQSKYTVWNLCDAQDCREAALVVYAQSILLNLAPRLIVNGSRERVDYYTLKYEETFDALQIVVKKVYFR